MALLKGFISHFSSTVEKLMPVSATRTVDQVVTGDQYKQPHDGNVLTTVGNFIENHHSFFLMYGRCVILLLNIKLPSKKLSGD